MMRWRIFSIGPTDVCIHTAVPLFIAYAWLTGHGPLTAVALLSVLLHECAHAAAAALAGQPPRRLELTPLGAVMHLEDEVRLPPVKRLLMLLAGPAMTLLLCILALQLTGKGWLPLFLGRTIFLSNLSILVVNLLPALPLDGGRVLAMLLYRMLPAHMVGRVMRVIGTALGVMLIALNIHVSLRYGGWNLSLSMAGCCLMYSASAATTTMAMQQLKSLLDRKMRLEGRGHLPVRRVAILAGTPLHRAIRLLAPRSLTEFTLMELGTLKPLGMMTEERLIACYLDSPQMTCLEAMRK